MLKKRRPINLRSFLVHKLRKISFSWPPRKEALQRARVELPPLLKKDGTPGKRPQIRYECEICGVFVKSNEILADHINPIVPVTGWDSWDGLIERLFCDSSGLQAICKPCHDKKTKEENEIRKKCKKS